MLVLSVLLLAASLTEVNGWSRGSRGRRGGGWLGSTVSSVVKAVSKVSTAVSVACLCPLGVWCTPVVCGVTSGIRAANCALQVTNAVSASVKETLKTCGTAFGGKIFSGIGRKRRSSPPTDDRSALEYLPNDMARVKADMCSIRHIAHEWRHRRMNDTAAALLEEAVLDMDVAIIMTAAKYPSVKAEVDRVDCSDIPLCRSSADKGISQASDSDEACIPGCQNDDDDSECREKERRTFTKLVHDLAFLDEDAVAMSPNSEDAQEILQGTVNEDE